MLRELFLGILDMSYVASIVILVIVIARLFLKRMPKKYSYLLWVVALVRLTIPFTFESVFSLLPKSQSPIAMSSSPIILNAPNTILPSRSLQVTTGSPMYSFDPVDLMIDIGALIWIMVFAFMIIYGVFSYAKMKRKLHASIHIVENIYKSDKIETPFVLGLFKPKIYMPSHVEEGAEKYIVLHESTHIKRKDHIVRLFSYLVLCLHWFNPLVWLAFILSERDMEMACDESVIDKLGVESKKSYSQTLLNLTVGRKLKLSPLAFSEGDTKSRIKNILKFKKPKYYVAFVLVILLTILGFSLLTNPLSDKSDFTGKSYYVGQIPYSSLEYSFAYTKETAPSFTISSDNQLLTSSSDSTGWQLVGGLGKVDTTKSEILSMLNFKETLSEAVSGQLNDIKGVYQVDDEEHFYLVVETTNNLYMMQGFYEQDRMVIRWIFDLEEMDEVKIVTSSDLLKYRTPYVGDNVSVLSIVNLLDFPDEYTYEGIELKTDSEPYGLTVNFTGPNGSDALKSPVFNVNAYILLSLIENLDTITFHVNDTLTMYYFRGNMEENLGYEVWPMSESTDKFEDFIEDITSVTAYDSDTSVETHLASDNPLELAIHDAIMRMNDVRSENSVSVESHVILDVDIKGDETDVYLMVLFLELEKGSDGLKTVSGSHMPVKLTFNYSDKYEFVEFWRPRDGAGFVEDVRLLFPDDVENLAMDTQLFVMSQTQSCYEQAVEALNIDVNRVLESLTNEVMSSPKTSSNPQDYIDDNYISYREMMYYGTYTLEFIEENRTRHVEDLKTKILELMLEDLTISIETYTS
ncbi:DUF4825 domain-containing protein [Acidaminobacter sp. JC074]|uniref:M56 family metallopeptidase n=1 Tax=Acidaminobacter sp. JC074 TaxID=2530199 RepID=UPI001F10CAFC|nr:M56 family metallopeptidase [Acidaminobacter sp. JC074]MCH4887957.1 DUF4825 domain-containing protein [Acidaminobacter sp. JC074]